MPRLSSLTSQILAGTGLNKGVLSGLTRSAAYRTMTGYAPSGRSGWTNGGLSPTDSDDGYAGPYANVMPAGTNWYMNNIAYNQYYVSTNGFLSFGSGSSGNGTVNSALAGLYPVPGDNLWGNGFAYKRGTSSAGWYFFSGNVTGSAYDGSGDRSWEINCFWNADNSQQYVEFVWFPDGPGGWAGNYYGITNGVTVFYTNTPAPTPSMTSYAWSSTNRGVTWTGAPGSWTGMGTF